MRALQLLRRGLDHLAERVRSEVASHLSPQTPEALRRAVAAAHAAMDSETARASTVAPACRKGCFYCCHVDVEVTIPEILVIADFLQRQSDPSTLDALRRRLHADLEARRPLSGHARYEARIPCALLVEGACSIHPSRPLRCRAFHSLSVDACQRAYAGVDDDDAPTNPIALRIADAVELGFDGALARAGLSPKPHLLEMGLAIALTHPDPDQAWIAGAPIFEPAVSPRHPPA